MPRYVAFLRAINITGRHVKMHRLREVFELLGYERVATHIASGNVVFDAATEPATETIETALHSELGFEVPVYLRTAAEVSGVVDGNPFPDAAELEVSFLPTAPEPDAIAALSATATGDDLLTVIGREVYWSHGDNTQDSDHSEARVVRILGMPTTRRSMRTVQQIADRYLG